MWGLARRIIQGVKKAIHNPIFMLDEVDKIGMDFRESSSALLESWILSRTIPSQTIYRC